MRCIQCFGASLLCLSAAQAYIQAGANVYGCVNYAEDQYPPVQIEFNVGGSGTQCMTDTGTSGSFVVTKGGLTCYKIGLVKNKPYDTRLDNCVVRSSLWTASFSTNNSQTGSTSSYWSADYKGKTECYVELRSQSTGTYLCQNQAMCSNTNYPWDYELTPTYYLIFQPEKVGNQLLSGQESGDSVVTVTEWVTGAVPTSDLIGGSHPVTVQVVVG